MIKAYIVASWVLWIIALSLLLYTVFSENDGTALIVGLIIGAGGAGLHEVGRNMIRYKHLRDWEDS